MDGGASLEKTEFSIRNIQAVMSTTSILFFFASYRDAVVIAVVFDNANTFLSLSLHFIKQISSIL